MTCLKGTTRSKRAASVSCRSSKRSRWRNTSGCDAPWRPNVPDALENITSRPFTSPVTLSGNAGPQMKAFAEDVEGQGNSLNVFARNIFDHAVSHGVAVFFPDYTRTIARKDGKPKTLADDKAEGARPFWTH